MRVLLGSRAPVDDAEARYRGEVVLDDGLSAGNVFLVDPRPRLDEARGGERLVAPGVGAERTVARAEDQRPC